MVYINFREDYMFGLEAKVLWLFVFVALTGHTAFIGASKVQDNQKQLEITLLLEGQYQFGFCSSSYGYVIFWLDFYGSSRFNL